jgi:hypothetical protein
LYPSNSIDEGKHPGALNCLFLTSRLERRGRSMLESGKSRLRDLHVVLRSIEAGAGSAYHLSIEDDWEASLHCDEIPRRDKCNTAVIYGARR